MNKLLKPIGLIHTPWRTKEEISSRRNADPSGFNDIRGTLDIYPEFSKGLKDIEGFSHLIILFSFHLSQEEHLLARPPEENEDHGVFATRSPHRPNFIGMTVVRLHRRQNNTLHVSRLDMLDKTPILDIKPYLPQDVKQDISLGWTGKNRRKTIQKK